MTAQGVFRDDFYNAMAVLPAGGNTANVTVGASVLPASVLVGSGDQYVLMSGNAAVAYTLDTAVNIIAALQQAVAVAYKAQIAGFGAGVNPPVGVPNLFNLGYTLTLVNNNTGTVTLTNPAGSGITIVGAAYTFLTATSLTYSVVVTSPTTVTFTRVSTGPA